MRNALKDKILGCIDIVEVIGETLALTRRGKDYVGLCPFHPDHKPSLTVSPTKQIFKCFACGAGGDVLRFVQLRDKLGFKEALALLARRAGIDLHLTDADRRTDQLRDQIRQALAWARSHFQRNLRETPGGAAALDYALGRGMTRTTVEHHGLGYAADAWDDLLQAATHAGLPREVLHQAGLITTNEQGKTYDRFRHRLIFPICDALGRPVAFGGRTLGDDPAKYLNSPETSLFSKSRVLYGLDLARRTMEQRREAIVVEGYTDTVLLHQSGFTHVVATLGTALTDAHVKLLKPLTDRLVLCFDGDQAGTRAADRAVEVSLLGGMEVRVAVLEAGSDPADTVLESGAPGFNAVLETAVDALRFKWAQTVDAFGDGGPGSRRAAVEALVDFIASLAATRGIDPLDQGLLVRRLSELLTLPLQAVQDMLAVARRRARLPASSQATNLNETSAYVALIRGLPAGLVDAVENCFGLLLADASCIEWMDDRFGQATETCPVWSRLHAAIRNVFEEQGDYTRADVIARCEDADVCELVSRSCARIAGTAATQEAFLAAYRKLESELSTERLGALQQNLPRRDEAGERGDDRFNELVSVARDRHSVLQADKRLSAKSAS